MKKTTRSLLISALILFCTGLLLALCTSLYAKIAKIEVFDVAKKARTIETRTISIDEILTQSPDSNYVKQLSPAKFSKIDLTSFAGDVVICSGGEDTELHLDQANTNNLSFSVIEDTLTIGEVDAVGFMGFYMDKGGISFKGLRHIFNPGNATNGKKTITIKIPEAFALNQIDVFSSIGDVTVDGISAVALNIECGSGNVEVKNLKNSEGKISVKGNFTDVKMSNNQYVNCAISTHFGDIDTHLVANSNGSTILDLWCGNIDVETDLPTTQYKLSIATTIGSISQNSKEIGKKLSSDGNGAFRISSGIFFGDFDLHYSGENEEDYAPVQPAPENSSVPEESATPTEQPAA